MTSSLTEPHPDVEVRIPADSAYVSVLRSTAAGLASRLDLDLTSIEDLRIAVGEACALALPAAEQGSSLTAAFFLAPGRLTVRVSVPGAGLHPPDRESFAWLVLDTLSSDASAEVDDDRLVIALTVGAESGSDPGSV